MFQLDVFKSDEEIITQKIIIKKTMVPKVPDTGNTLNQIFFSCIDSTYQHICSSLTDGSEACVRVCVRLFLCLSSGWLDQDPRIPFHSF